MTECSGGEWQKGNLLEQQVRLIINSTRNWAKTVVLWNMALDQNHEPFLGGCTNCRGVVTVNHSVSPALICSSQEFSLLMGGSARRLHVKNVLGFCVVDDENQSPCRQQDCNPRT